jgi:hypothetical protein
MLAPSLRASVEPSFATNIDVYSMINKNTKKYSPKEKKKKKKSSAHYPS